MDEEVVVLKEEIIGELYLIRCCVTGAKRSPGCDVVWKREPNSLCKL